MTGKLLIFSLTLAGATLVAGAQAPGGRPADLVLYNGRVITVDQGFSIAQAVAVAGDRIVAVGDDATVRAHAGAGTRTIDLHGRAVIPGLMDNHLHSAGGGPGVDLSRTRSLDEVYAAFGARRLMWGSDYPLVGGREGDRNALNFTLERFAGKTDDERDLIFGGVARAVFRARA